MAGFVTKTWWPRFKASEAMGKWVESGVKIITADPLGRALKAVLSKDEALAMRLIYLC